MFSFGIIADNFEVFENEISIYWARCLAVVTLPVVTAESG